MSELKISSDYINALKDVTQFTKDFNTKEVLVFSKNDTFYLSKFNTNSNIWLNVAASKEHISANLDEFALINLDEFIRYLNSSKFIKDPTAKIEFTSARNDKYDLPVILLNTKNGKYYIPQANTAIFTSPYDRKLPVNRDLDPIPLKTKFILSKTDIENLISDVSSMNSPQIFGFDVSDTVTIYLKGTANQQFEKRLDPLCVKVLDNYTTIEDTKSNGGCKLFPTRFLDTLSLFDCDFDIDYRIHTAQTGTKTASLKAYGTYETKEGKINIVVGVLENISHAITNMFEIYRTPALVA